MKKVGTDISVRERQMENRSLVFTFLQAVLGFELGLRYRYLVSQDTKSLEATARTVAGSKSGSHCSALVPAPIVPVVSYCTSLRRAPVNALCF